jgi:hypothetical protein
MDLNNLLEEISNDISFNESDLNTIKESTDKFIEEELDKINRYLKKSVLDFTKKEIENLKKNKMDLLNKNINTITESVLIQVSEEYNLDKKKVLEDNKINLLEINNFHNLYEEDNNLLELNNTLNDIEDNVCDEDNKKNNDKPTTKIKKKTVELDKTTENYAYKNHLIQQKKCPIFQKGKYCEKTAKHGHYCGYHKKFNI